MYVSCQVMECTVVTVVATPQPISKEFAHALFGELTRLLNHTMGIGIHALDVGAMTPVFFKDDLGYSPFWSGVLLAGLLAVGCSTAQAQEGGDAAERKAREAEIMAKWRQLMDMLEKKRRILTGFSDLLSMFRDIESIQVEMKGMEVSRERQR